MTTPVALVTGGSRGIGRAIALTLADAGMDIVLTYAREMGDAEDVANTVCQRGRSAMVLPLEAASPESIQTTIKATLDKAGRIDVLVNNAGFLHQKPYTEITVEEFDHMLAVNLRAPFLLAQQVIPIMQQQGGGTVVNIASIGGQLGGPLAVHYSASKGAVITLTRSLARLGAPSVRVNCVSPGLIATDMTRVELASPGSQEKQRQILLGRPGTTDEVASVVAFLASPASAYMTGQVLNVNGGLFLG